MEGPAAIVVMLIVDHFSPMLMWRDLQHIVVMVMVMLIVDHFSPMLTWRDLQHIVVMLIVDHFSPMLTWRDLQHIVVMTAKPDYLEDPNWVTNGVGRKGNIQ